MNGKRKKRSFRAIIVFTCITLVFGNAFASNKVDLKATLTSSVVPKDGNPLTYSVFNLFDNNIGTTLAIESTKRKEENFGLFSQEKREGDFELFFQKRIKVDKIKILNGYQKSMKVYSNNSRVKEIEISLRLKVSEEETSHLVLVITNELRDITNWQTINLKVPIEINVVYFVVQSVYPGTKYDDICISEIEFWNGNEKYEIANLEQAKKDYLLLLRKDLERKLADLPMVVTFERTDPYYQTLKRMGFEPETIHHGDYYEGYYLEFRKNKKIYLYHPREIFKKKKGLKYINYEKGILIGEWKIDELSRFWIKVGTGEWKFIRNGEWARLKGTDLEAQDVDMGNSVYEELAHGRGW